MPPSVLSSASTLVNQPVVLPLTKISYCATTRVPSPTQWTHLTHRRDMYAVFETVRRQDGADVAEKTVLRLTEGPHLVVGHQLCGQLTDARNVSS